jgi:hypothetical protein
VRHCARRNRNDDDHPTSIGSSAFEGTDRRLLWIRRMLNLRIQGLVRRADNDVEREDAAGQSGNH